MKDIFGNDMICDNNGAEFSPCGKYRYQLWRIWDEALPTIAFIGLNPSTANADKNDPTIRIIISVSKQLGYGGVFMYNLFSIISSKPEILLSNEDLQKNNQWYLDEILTQCKDVCFAWGSFKQIGNRANEIVTLFDNALCLGKTKSGAPLHPLALMYNGTQNNPKLIKYKNE